MCAHRRFDRAAALAGRNRPIAELTGARANDVAVVQLGLADWQLASIYGDNRITRKGTDHRAIAVRSHDEMPRHQVGSTDTPGCLRSRPDYHLRIQAKLLQRFIVLEPRHASTLDASYVIVRDS